MGLLVCDATPVRIRRHGPQLLTSLERIYRLNTGRGLPAGVTLIDPPSIARWSSQKGTSARLG
jgi:hypothetical protein